MRMTTATFMALGGALTGIASAVVPDGFANALKPVSALFLLEDSSVHPAVIFGPIVSVGFWSAGERRSWVLVLVFLATLLAWSAALRTAFWIYDPQHHRVLFGHQAVTSSSSQATLLIQLATGFIAGIVGATIMVVGGALAVPCLRGVRPIVTTAVVGGLAGLLLYFFLSGWHQTVALAILMSVWQASVGACLGHWLARLNRE